MAQAGESERFWAKVEKTDGCWLWTANTCPAGYGKFRIGSRSNGTRRQVYAHRWSYEQLVGPIPDGLQIDHLCRVRSCVNPAHLEPVTRRENILRGEAPSALHALKTHCPQGHAYDEENTYVWHGRRHCRACQPERQRRYKAARP